MGKPKSKASWILLILIGIISVLVAIPAYTAPSQVDDREQGLRLLNLKRYQDAEKRFSKVLENNPSDPDGYHFRGMARLYQNNLPGATKDFQKALKLAPADAGVMASLGKAHFQSGKTGKAIKILDKAVKADPDNYKAINQLAWVLAVTPQKEFQNGTRAVMLAKRLVTKDENVHTLDTLAAAYAANKQFKKAVSTQEKAVAILVNRSLTNDMGPYMERLKTYQQNKSWRHRVSDSKLSAKAKKKPSDEKGDKKVKPVVEKPIIKKPAIEKPVATQKPKESSVVAKTAKTDPKVVKKPPAAKPMVEKPAIKEPVKEKPVAAPKTKESKIVAKAGKTDPKVAKTPPAAKPKIEKPAAKEPVKEKPVAAPKPKESKVVAKARKTDPKVAKIPPAAKPKIEEPAIKEPVKEKPVAAPKPKESKIVAKAVKTVPKVAKIPPAAKPKVEKPTAKLPAADDLTAKPPPTTQEAAPKDKTVTTQAPLFVKKRPASLLAKKRLKKNRLPKKELPPFYPYTIQIASFRDGEKAFFIANHLRQKGDPAFTGPVTLNDSGKWHRVLLGWHTSAESAQKQLKTLKERQFREPAVVRRPYTVLIESSRDMNRLERIERRLKEMGELPYRLSDRTKKGYWRMLVGAYSDDSIPSDFAERLRQSGFQPVMVMR